MSKPMRASEGATDFWWWEGRAAPVGAAAYEVTESDEQCYAMFMPLGK